jgi:hypothetical protein
MGWKGKEKEKKWEDCTVREIGLLGPLAPLTGGPFNPRSRCQPPRRADTRAPLVSRATHYFAGPTHQTYDRA